MGLFNNNQFSKLMARVRELCLFLRDSLERCVILGLEKGIVKLVILRVVQAGQPNPHHVNLWVIQASKFWFA